MNTAEKTTLLFFVIIISCAQAHAFYLKETLFEGETKNLTSDGYTYHIKLVTVYDSVWKALFEVNGERTSVLSKDDTYRFSDGSAIFIREVMPQNLGKDLVQYNFFPASHDATAKAEEPEEFSDEPAPPAKTRAAEVAEENTTTTIDDTEQPQQEETAPQPEVTTAQTAKPGFWKSFKDWIRHLIGAR